MCANIVVQKLLEIDIQARSYFVLIDAAGDGSQLTQRRVISLRKRPTNMSVLFVRESS